MGNIAADNGLSPIQSQAMTWINGDLLPVETFQSNSSVIWIEIQ